MPSCKHLGVFAFLSRSGLPRHPCLGWIAYVTAFLADRGRKWSRWCTHCWHQTRHGNDKNPQPHSREYYFLLVGQFIWKQNRPLPEQTLFGLPLNNPLENSPPRWNLPLQLHVYFFRLTLFLLCFIRSSMGYLYMKLLVRDLAIICHMFYVQIMMTKIVAMQYCFKNYSVSHRSLRLLRWQL